MGSTNRFGFTTFTQGGSISDQNYKFSSRDRESMDALLWSLFHHDHGQSTAGVTSIQGPVNRPSLTPLTSGGTIPAGQTYYYRISYLDAFGNETEASTQSTIDTPNPIAPPQAPDLATASTGGLLGPGTYRYALAFTQSNGTTRAPYVSAIVVPTGTNTNTVTITLPTLPSGASGWAVYRRDPNSDEFYFLDSVGAGPSEYVDDGSQTLDCNVKRPTTNTTNSKNRVTIAIHPNDLPLSPLVRSWRIYRTTIGGVYRPNSLVAEVVDTTTEGGTDLVTSFIDNGQGASTGMPLEQTAAPPVIPGIDAELAFSPASGRIPGALAPWRVSQFHTFISGEIANATTYNQTHLYEDMVPSRIEATFLMPPSGVDASNHGTIRVKDTADVDAVHLYWANADAQNEFQRIITSTATAGVFTLTFDGQTTTDIAFDATGEDIANALEALANITSVFVSGTGTSTDPYVVEFQDPGDQDLPQMTYTPGTGFSGFVSISTSINGSSGGTFTLSDGTDTTDPIAYDAAASIIKTRLETDITSITTVSVTGVGTLNNPWRVVFEDPGGTDVDLLAADVTNLNGSVDRAFETRGHGNTIIDLECDSTGSHHFWAAPTVVTDLEHAQNMFTDGGVEVSDGQAASGVAVALGTQNEYVSWHAGVLDAAEYVVRFWVADVNEGATFEIAVFDYNTGTVTAVVDEELTPARAAYVPAYELEFTADGTMDIAFQVTKTDAGGSPVRVDRIEYDALLKTFLAGETLTVEGVVDGSPTNAGENVQLNVWY